MSLFKFNNLNDFKNDISNCTYETDIVEDVMPIGVSLLFASMKQGKSLLALSAALSVSNPDVNEWLGFPVLKHGNVLYFGLDDSDKILHDRLDKYCRFINFYVVNFREFKSYCSHPALKGMSDCVKFNSIVNDFIAQFGGVDLVIADTFEKIRDSTILRTYTSEVEEVSILKQNAQLKRYNLLLVHHSTKYKTGDVFERFYGSNGLGAESDVLMSILDFNGSSKVQVFQGKGNGFKDFKLLVKKDSELDYFKLDQFDGPIDSDARDIKIFTKISNYFTKKSKDSGYYCFEGEYQDLMAELDLETTPQKLGIFLKNNVDNLKLVHIKFSTRHTRKGTFLRMEIQR